MININTKIEALNNEIAKLEGHIEEITGLLREETCPEKIEELETWLDISWDNLEYTRRALTKV